MGIEFENKPLEWNEQGIEPPKDLRDEGFKPGYRPPASYFNNFMHRTFASIKELQNKACEIQAEAEDKDGGNAATLDGKTVADLQDYSNLINKPELNFANFKTFDSIAAMRQSEYEGAFAVGDVAGYSFRGGGITNTTVVPDKKGDIQCYMRIYCDNGNWCLAVDYYYSCVDDSWWKHNDVKRTEFQGHKHTKDDITDFPLALPANGGNADTVGGKAVNELMPANPDEIKFEYDDGYDSEGQQNEVKINSGGVSIVDTNWGVENKIVINGAGIAANGSTRNISIKGFEEIKAKRFEGGGAGITDVDAKTLGGKALADIKTACATIVVSASDTLPTKAKDNADFVCTGTNDQTTIQNAVNALPSNGGKIILLNGTYNFLSGGSAIGITKPNVVIEGMGRSTEIKISYTEAITDSIFNINESYFTLKNLAVEDVENIDVTEDNTTSHFTVLLNIVGQNIKYISLDNVYMSTGSEYSKITAIQRDTANTSLSFININNCEFNDGYRVGISLSNVSHISITNTKVHISDADSVVLSNCNYVNITNNEFYSSFTGYASFVASNCNKMICTHNFMGEATFTNCTNSITTDNITY